MALRKRGKYRYGDSQAEIRDEVLRYSRGVGYRAQHYVDVVCKCGGTLFQLMLDDTQGVAVRTCISCKSEHPMGDSEEFLEEAELKECACPCGSQAFEISVAVSLHDESEDVRWLYVGCRCPACSLTAIDGDWKNEFIGYKELLARV